MAAITLDSPQTKTATYEFESGRSLQNLLGNDIRLLKEAEHRLQVRMIARDGKLTIEGEAAAVRRASRFIDRLKEARERGLELSRHTFLFALSGLDNGSIDDLASLASEALVVSSKRPPILPRSQGQLRYLRAIAAKDVMIGIGPAGTGKTYLAMAAAVAALKKGSVTRIILTRPAVEAGEALGFLPGSLQEKIFPYLRPLYDALQDMMDAEEVQRHMERGVVEIAPLAYMRGRTLNNAFMILDEGQNTTPEQMFMFLTRLGEGSKCVVNGDITQIDLPAHKTSGLVEARMALANTEGVEILTLQEADVVRHPLVASILRAYKQHRETVGAQPTR